MTHGGSAEFVRPGHVGDLKARSAKRPDPVAPYRMKGFEHIADRAERIAAGQAWMEPCGWCGRPSGLDADRFHVGCAAALAKVEAEKAAALVRLGDRVAELAAVVDEIEASGEAVTVVREGEPVAVVVRPDVLDALRHAAGIEP